MNYLATNASFTLSINGVLGNGADEQFTLMTITNSAGPSSPIVVTLSGAAAGSCCVTGGVSASWAVTNKCKIFGDGDGATNLVVKTQ